MQQDVQPQLSSAIRGAARPPRRAARASLLSYTNRCAPPAAKRATWRRRWPSSSGTARILIREYGCADPHLEGADLRIAALVDYKNMCGDPIGAAVSAIEKTWQRWLGDYLANHRCT